MIDRIKVVIVSLTMILLIVSFVIGLFIQESNNKNIHELNKLYSRKEDLLNQHQKLSHMIERLNETLQFEISKNKELNLELEQTNKELNKSITLNTRSKQPPPTAPTLRMRRRMTTRAS